MKKNLSIFISETIGCAVFSFLGSAVGHRFGQTPLFTGGLLGGIFGVALTTRILVKINIIEKQRNKRTTSFGIASFLLAAVLALSNLHSPLVPLLSLLLVGTGCVLGYAYPIAEENKRSYQFALIGLLSLCPALYFIFGSLIKYNLGIRHAFTLLDWLEANAVRQHYFNLISPVIFIGGLLFCLFLNGSLLVRRGTPVLAFNKLIFKGGGVNWLMVLTSGALLTLLLLYVIFENA